MTFDEIVLAYDDTILSSIRSRLGPLAVHSDLVDDIKQDVLIRLLTLYRDGKLDEIDSAFIFTICIGVVVDHIRHMSSRSFMFEQVGANADVHTTSVIDEEDELSVINRERIEKLDQMLAGCSEEVRSVFELKRQGLTHQSIADALGLTKNKVGHILWRHVKKFREMANVAT